MHTSARSRSRRRPGGVRALLLASLLVLLPAGPAAAQPEGRPAAFRTLGFGLQGVAPVVANAFGDAWRTLPGLELSVEAPFYAGHVHVGGVLLAHGGRTAEIPDFAVGYVFVGWGPRLALPFGLAWQNTVTAGDYLMRFGAEERAYYRTESELGVGLRSTLTIPLAGRWRLEAGATVLHVFTLKPVRHGFATAGLRYVLDAPGWLQRVLL